MTTRCEIISVGTELLLGNIVNTDAQDISVGLSELGINVFWHTVVGDNDERLRECVNIAKTRANIIITTGGLGPTYDDMTKKTLADAFNLKLVFDEEEAEKLRAHFMLRAYGKKMTENNLNQAWLPEGCTKFGNTCGTAPGCAFEKDGVIVIMLPGPPSECRAMFNISAVPYLKAKSDVQLKSRNIHIFGMGESAVEDKLHDMMVTMTNPTLAPYAKTGECMVRVTARGKDEKECDALIEPQVENITSILGDVVYSSVDETLEALCVRLLREKGKKVVVAEEMSGGLLSKRITDIPGAYDVFAGGITGYVLAMIGEKNEISSAAAAKMAQAARKSFFADYGLALCGSLGTESADADIPAGTVYAAIDCAAGTWVRELKLGSNRDRTRTVSASHALDLLRRAMQGMEMNAGKVK